MERGGRDAHLHLGEPEEDGGDLGVRVGLGHRQVLGASPRRQNPVNKYNQSGSAKKKKVKDSPCQFCRVCVRDGSELVNHLQRNQTCAKLYLRIHKVKNFDSLLLKLYSCIVCYTTKQMDFKKHLGRNEMCLLEYQRKMDEEDISKIHKKVLALKRAAIPSRSKAARGLDYEKQKKSRDDAKLNKTMTGSLNDFRDKTMYSNYRKCALCLSNFGDYSARELKDHEEWFKELNLDCEAKKSVRRFQKFFICNKCDKSSENVIDEGSEIIHLGENVEEDTILFFPDQNSDGFEVETIEESKIKLMLPQNCDALDQIKDLKIIRGRAESIKKLYETEKFDRATVSAIYQNEVNKYKNIKVSGERYVACVKDFKKKLLSSVDKVVDSSRITCSSGWFSNLDQEMKHRQDQFGKFFLAVKFELPQTSPEVIATCLVQEGFVVSVDKKGSSTGESKISYLIHLDHSSSVDCSDECVNRIDLEEFLDRDVFDKGDLGNKFIGTYVSEVHQKLIAFVNCIVLAPASELLSQNHHLMLMYDCEGKAFIVGALWPDALNTINLNVALDNGELKEISELREFADRNLAASFDPRLLRAAFNVSEVEAVDLSKLVEKIQLHICEDELCPLCLTVDLPSLETKVKGCCSIKNSESAMRLKKLMLRRLERMPFEDKTSISTWDWLQRQWENVYGEMDDGLERIIISFEDEQEDIEFNVDQQLGEELEEFPLSPLTAVYQYAISRQTKDDIRKVVMKRLKIVDCYVKPFNPLYLKSLNSPVMVEITDNIEYFTRLVSEIKGNNAEQVDPQLLFSHRLVSLAEGVSLMDKTKKRLKSSTTTEFVNIKPFRKICFKKVYEDSEENFKVDGSDDKFQIIPNNISRHFDRINGEDLLLAESSSWYDYVGAVKSQEISQTFSNCDVPLSDVKCVHSDSCMPEFLLCSNGDVLKKRKSQKILVFPKPRSDYVEMYGRCLLYLNVKKEEELLEPNLREKYMELHEDEQDTLVDFNEKQLFKMKVRPKDKDEPLEVERNEDEVDREEPIDVEPNGEDDIEQDGMMLDYLLEALDEVDSVGEDREDPIDVEPNGEDAIEQDAMMWNNFFKL